MIIVIKPDASEQAIEQLKRNIENQGLIVQDIKGGNARMLGLAGEVASVSPDSLSRMDIVESVLMVREPYKLAGRRFHPRDTIVAVGQAQIGGGHFSVIAGPCSVEGEDQILSIARDIAKSGAEFLRGGAFKPRSSPYAFHGLGLDGLELLKAARQKTGLPIVSEILSTDHLDAFAQDVDVIQIGARNMQNFSLLVEVGKLKKPVLLKRGLSSSLEELLMSAEYLIKGGTEQVILCERGIRTFETATRNTLDLSAIPVLKQKSHLPVIADPSHGTGHWQLVAPLALAAVAAGADGLIIEVHNMPQKALCDGQQSITPEVFHNLMKKINRVREAIK
ncbi:MAG TPA: 3-deoxy-7-phosphoheptulonate synthase [Bacillota bacterium]|jgi:3-deoxy-7-phosphoheptulonate synthase|nr:3-deoxy-7-phosphoheptulonate synthase [Bacillota bacterium]